MTDHRHSLVHHFLEAGARSFPGKPAIVHDGASYTYEEINRMADRFAAWLAGRGVQKGDRVLILLFNGAEYVVSYYGAMKAGAIPVSLSTGTTEEGLRPILAELEAAVCVTSKRFEDVFVGCDLAGAGVRSVLVKDPDKQWPAGPAVDSWDDVVTVGGEASPVKVDVSDNDLAGIIYTSGSTGTPKGVMLTHANIVSNVASICTYLKLTDKDIQMAVLPFFYVMGKSLLNTHFAVGGTVVINNRFAFTAAVLKEMAELEVTGFSGVPSTYAYLLHRSPLLKYRDRLPRLRYCSQAGGHMSRQIKEDLRKALPPHTDIFIMYGATEASARLTYLEPEKFAGKIDSIGRAIPGVTMRVVGEDGSELSAGQVGELTGSGPNIMQGYWKDEELSRKVLDHNGYHTGDLGYKDEEGYLYLVGRRDNLLKVSGHRINPQEIEDAIMTSGLVVETAVVGVPDHLLGNRLVAVSVAVEQSCTADDILKHCVGVLPKYKVPSEVIFTRSLPKKASGKVDRVGCKKMVGA
ncbi:MAG TPA: class I adenylate-forming enzyme family protein [Spirochaetota bacterium]|nr:class I adenylate-forming enzyme family protein [Spirochaetota bacterium]HPI90174.1 class I adenylate-forming enzyme family protein [Spirochaetota bacterium]HPR49613.1 class I adenylate-forming enzyme family protein [Spirochaetota bacterium]